MKNFCLYNGKKIVKPEIWNIASIELSSDYTSAIIQAESKSNKSEYTLDITSLISNQYEGGLDSYSSTIVNELTGVSDWILDSDNNRVVYTEEYGGVYQVGGYADTQAQTKEASCRKYYDYYKTGSYEYKGTIGDECYWTHPDVPDRTYKWPIFTIQTGEQEEKYLPLLVVAQQVISNAEGGDTQAQQAIISTFNNITDDILTSDYSEFFEANKQPK